MKPLSFHQPVAIMATIGPSLESEEDIAAALEAGAEWFRLPMGYRTRDHVEHGLRVRRVATREHRAAQLFFDLPSERLRLAAMEPKEVAPNEEWWIAERREGAPADAMIAFGLAALRGAVEPGHRLLALDGRVEMRVLEWEGEALHVAVERGGRLQTNNSLVFPDSEISFALVTEADRELILRASSAGLAPDWVAMSLVSSATEFAAARDLLRSLLPPDTRFMVKFETAAAVRDISRLVAEADGLMVARGDLGQIVPPAELPLVQATLAEAARAAGKPAVIATQFLETFAETGVPQRCELTDLATAAHQQAAAIMLGKETVYGRYPIESIRLARRCLDAAAEPRLPAALFLREPRRALCSVSPRLVAIEGGNGTGKSTLLTSLANAHPDWPLYRGVPDAWMEPKLKMRMIRDADWMASALYFFSGTMELTRELITAWRDAAPPLALLDRCLWSTLAVHAGHHPARLRELLPVLAAMSGHVCIPDVTIVLTASLETLRQRIAQKEADERAYDELTQHHAYWEGELMFYQWLREAVSASGFASFRVEILATDDLSPSEVARQVETLLAS